MTPLEAAQKELDDIDRANGLDQCPYWKPLYVPQITIIAHKHEDLGPYFHWKGASLTTIDGILKDTYNDMRAEMDRSIEETNASASSRSYHSMYGATNQLAFEHVRENY